MFSCNNSRPGKPLFNAAYILDTFPHFWKYWYYHVHLAQDYEVFDTQDKKVPKRKFLKKLTTGNYLPLKLQSKDTAKNFFRLIRIKNLDHKRDIRKYLALFGNIYLKYLNYEGKPIPNFCFNALNGKTYTNENCMGHFIVIDCWFVGCHACVEEMPEVNKLAEKYENMIFIGLALNSKKSLKRFLTKVKLKYTVVPKMEKYLRDSLKVPMYPTYVVVNKKGNIINYSNSVRDLKTILKSYGLR